MVVVGTLLALASLTGYFFFQAGGNLSSWLHSIANFFLPSTPIGIGLYACVLAFVLYRLLTKKRQKSSVILLAFLAICLVAVVEKSSMNLYGDYRDGRIDQEIQKNRKTLDQGIANDNIDPSKWDVVPRSKNDIGVFGALQKKTYYYFSLGHDTSLEAIQKLEALQHDDFKLVRLPEGKAINHCREVRQAIEKELAKLKIKHGKN